MKIDIKKYEEQRIKNILDSGNYIKAEIIVPITDSLNEEDERPSAKFVCMGKNPSVYELGLVVHVMKIMIQRIQKEDEDIKKCVERLEKNLEKKIITVDIKDKKENKENKE